jgi:FtsP/CotA-like multicopper oxidase with cupredoxin domain
MTASPFERIHLGRRAFVAATVASGFALAGCGRSASPATTSLDPAIAAAEAARPHTGRTVTASLTAQAETIDLGGTLAGTLAYGTGIPAPLIRANVGDELAVTVTNRLNHPTSVHWHGIALRNDMDGAAPATPTSTPVATSPTGSRCPMPAPTGPIHIPVSTPTSGCTCQ